MVGVLEKLGPVDGAVGCGLDALGEFHRRLEHAVNLEPQLVVGAQPQLALEGADVGDTVMEVHGPRLTPFKGFASRKGSRSEITISPQNGVMVDWIQHPNWLSDLKAYQARTGEDQMEVAEHLGISFYTLRNWVTGSKVPSFRRKKESAELFGTDVHRYIDAPTPDTSDLGEVGRFQLEQAREVLSDPRLTDADRQELVNELKAKAKWMLSFKSEIHGRNKA